jgi:hypothetical protein
VGLYPASTLERLADGAEAALGDAFVGVYLHGSFGGGYADAWSDVDFLVLTTRDLDPAEESRLQTFHAELYADGPKPWAQRLDGSYAPAEWFGRIDPERRAFLYLDNGSSHLIRDPHCNTAVIRHLVREHSVVLAGPDPRTAIDPISPTDLRAEAHTTLEGYVAWLERDRASFRGWDQAYFVLTVCRLLLTAQTGEIAGKAQAAEWATRELDPRWHQLVEQAIADRDDPEWRGRFPAEAERLDETAAFVAYALAKR